MGFPWTARTRRLLLVIVAVVLLLFPLVSTMLTRARVERSGTEVTATVLQVADDNGRYLVAYRLPKDVDPEQQSWSRRVDEPTYRKAAQTKTITAKVLEGHLPANRVEGQIDSITPWVVTGISVGLVLIVGLWWVKVGRRRPPVRMRADADLVAAGSEERPALTHQGGELYEAIGPVTSTEDGTVVVDVGERRVVVVLGEYDNPVAVGGSVRARGPLVG
jgi:hypothetical protein